MNATFANTLVRDGKVAFISQSGALGCAVLDWALTNNIGMSNFVSIGSMMDVDFGDLIEYFNKDNKTEAIFLYIESLTEPQKFILNSRSFASKKPIFAIKSGREAEGAKAASSHTGALAGEDTLYGAAFNKAGIVRLDTSSEFMDLFEAVSLQPIPKGNRLLIITNAGGPGVMATDYLIKQGGKLAELTEGTIAKLNGFLPPFWSHANPVDLLGDAADDRYVMAFDVLLKDEKVDAVLVLLTPQAMTKSTETAAALVEKAKNSGKPVLASWMGQGMVEEGRAVLMKGGIPVYDTPEEAINSFILMHKSARQADILAEMQEIFTFQKPNKEEIRLALKGIASTGRKILSEQESKELLEKYGIRTTLPRLARSPQEASELAKSIGFPIVMKVQSEDISHKSDANCVMLDIKDEATASKKFDEIMVNARSYRHDARIDGVSIQKMATPGGFEVILGSKQDALFGPSVLFGMGGVAVEAIKDTSIMLAPINRNQSRSLIGSTKIGTMLKKGFRNQLPANMALLEEVTIRFSELAAEYPEIKEIDINPLRVDDKSCLVLDARIILS
jgi:acetyltransferase